MEELQAALGSIVQAARPAGDERTRAQRQATRMSAGSVAWLRLGVVACDGKNARGWLGP